MADHFNEFPEDVRNKLLLNFSKINDAVGLVIRIVAYHHNELPADIKCLLFKLSESDNAEYVASAIANNFDKLPENVTNLLVKISDNEYTAEYVAWALYENFDKIPTDFKKNLLVNLSKKDTKFFPKFIVEKIGSVYNDLNTSFNRA